jgi:hypothetical protein
MSIMPFLFSLFFLFFSLFLLYPLFLIFPGVLLFFFRVLPNQSHAPACAPRDPRRRPAEEPPLHATPSSRRSPAAPHSRPRLPELPAPPRRISTGPPRRTTPRPSPPCLRSDQLRRAPPLQGPHSCGHGSAWGGGAEPDGATISWLCLPIGSRQGLRHQLPIFTVWEGAPWSRSPPKQSLNKISWCLRKTTFARASPMVPGFFLASFLGLNLGLHRTSAISLR